MLAAAVLVYEILAEDELLSEAVDRYRRRHPIVTQVVIGYVAAHLLRIVPRQFDPLHRLGQFGR